MQNKTNKIFTNISEKFCNKMVRVFADSAIAEIVHEN